MGGAAPGGRWVFQRGMDVCACVHMCWLFEIKFDLFFCWNMKLGPLKWSVYNVAFAENDLEFLDTYEVTDRSDIWKLRFLMQLWRPPATSPLYSR